MPDLRSPFAARFGYADAVRLAAAARMFADPSRLRILALLHQYGRMNVAELCSATGLPQPNVSHHLLTMERAGLLDRERVGATNYRRLNRDAVGELAALLHPVGGL